MDYRVNAGSPKEPRELKMSCFEWQNQLSNFLDNTLETSLQKAALHHLKKCAPCEEKLQHYRLILTQLSELPKQTLPRTLHQGSRSLNFLRPETFRMSLSQWERVPWYIRLLLESTGIVFAILIVISTVPKIRALYEKDSDQHLNDFRDDLNTAQLNHEETTEPSYVSSPALTLDEDDLEGENDSDESKITASREKADLWRFTLKTVSPEELYPLVLKMLRDLNIPIKTSTTQGVKVPGGIELDLIVSKELIPDLKKALENLQTLAPVESHVENTAKTFGPSNFTWYRVKSKRPLPEGKSKVVIWLAQPNS